MAKADNGHGGKRSGAGRPKGSRMRRSDELAQKLIAKGHCPAEALARLAVQAEAEGDIREAISAWKSLLPYVYPKPKPIEIAPELAIELAHELAEVRRDRQDTELTGTFAEMVERRFNARQERLEDPVKEKVSS